MNEEYLTKKELQEALKVSPSTVGRWLREGVPREQLGERIIRFKLPEVLEWLKENG